MSRQTSKPQARSQSQSIAGAAVALQPMVAQIHRTDLVLYAQRLESEMHPIRVLCQERDLVVAVENMLLLLLMPIHAIVNPIGHGKGLPFPCGCGLRCQ